MRLAIVGAYGSGKTTLSSALSRLTATPRTHGSPMLRPLGSSRRTIRDCTVPELMQMIVGRFTERVVREAKLSGNLVSDGSVMHEWVYGKVRMVAGSYPDTGAALRSWPRSEDVRCYENVIDELGLLMRQHAAAAYDAFAFLPIEFPLAEDEPPISEHFRVISDELLLDALGQCPVPTVVLRGTLDERIRQALDTFDLHPLMSNDDVLSQPVR